MSKNVLAAGPRRRRPSRDENDTRTSRDKSPGVGNWLARAVPSEHDLDLDALAEAAELGIDTSICGSLLADIRSDPPPKFASAQAAIGDIHRDCMDVVSSSAVLVRERASSSSAALPPKQVIQQPHPRASSASRAAAEVLKPSRPPLPGSGTGSAANSPRSSAAVPSGTDDSSFSSAMATRLLKAEQLNQQLAAQLAERSRENLALRAENEALRQWNPEADGNAVEALLRKECEDLRSQVQQMTQLMNEFGLRSPLDPPGDPERGQLRSRDGSETSEGMTVDIHVISDRLQELNEKLETNVTSLALQRGGGSHIARLPTEEQWLPVIFFSDGLKLADHAFIPYNLRPAQQVLKDILDVSFPRALRSEFPSGAHLRAVNRTSSTFAAWLRNGGKDDVELADGGDRLRPSVGHAVQKDLRSVGDRFVAKLPERVIRQGRVCNIRAAVAKQIGVPPAISASGSSNSAGKSDEVSLLDPSRHSSAPFARLQVKLEAGQRVLLCMEPHATVGALWDALIKWQMANGIPRSGADGRHCSLRSAFPPRVYTDLKLTLEMAGLTPSATLFVQ